MSNMAVHFSSEETTWETPADFFATCDNEFGFTLDVCATAINAKVDRFFSPEDDFFKQDTAGEICWMNPPYGREIGKFMQQAYNESLRGALYVCLVPARTDTAWFQDIAMKGEVRFLRGRLKFGDAKSCAPFPSALVIFRPQ